jgi:hypothetical protein
MRTLRDVTSFVGEQPLLMALLRAVATLEIQDCIPLLGDFLEEGLSILGYSCEEFEIGRL